jgi:formamidopyrimidine-DNA glycosylase
LPELPEMEHYKRLLTERIQQQRIQSIEVERERSLNVSVDEFRERVLGKQVLRIERRAKHLLFHLEGEQVLLLHLMLGGWMFYGTEADRPDRTIQVRLGFGEHHLYFIGLRLGYLHLMTFHEVEEKLAKLGPEPLDADFTPERLQLAASKKRGLIKMVLVDQSVLSGIGNCYSDEICFAAGILPRRRTSELNNEEWVRLHRGMQSALREALQYGGYMENPFFVGDRLTGGYNERCKVYDRGEEPCLRCGEPIRYIEMSGRKCFYCARCQT